MKYGIFILVLCFASALAAQQDRAYSFEQFRAPDSFVIVDELNGQLFDPPFRAISMDDLNLKDILTGLGYKANSSLLTASGCPEGKNCGTRYYQWNGVGLVPLHGNPGTPKPETRLVPGIRN